MKHIIFSLIVVSTFALHLGAIAADAKANDTISEQTSNAHREMQILTAFSRNPHLHGFDFSVSVAVDKVVLGGTVDDDINRNLAEKIATDADGITLVVNHIVVDAACMRLDSAHGD